MVEFNFTLIIQILNFFVLVAIIGKFGFGPLMRTLDARKARIAADLSGAEQAQAQLDTVRTQIEQEKTLATRQLAEEREELVKNLRAEVVELATAIAERLIAKNLDADMNRKLINDCIEKLATKQVGR